MSTTPRRDGVAAVGVGAAACAACCAGPIIGILGAIGLGTVVGVLLFGIAALAIAAIGLAAVLLRRRRTSMACDPTDAPVAVETPTVRTSR